MLLYSNLLLASQCKEANLIGAVRCCESECKVCKPNLIMIIANREPAGSLPFETIGNKLPLLFRLQTNVQMYKLIGFVQQVEAPESSPGALGERAVYLPLIFGQASRGLFQGLLH